MSVRKKDENKIIKQYFFLNKLILKVAINSIFGTSFMFV